MFKKNKEEFIEFICTVPGLDKLEDCVPKPAKNYIPDWFKDIKSKTQNTVKICPSFPDYFSQGYIIPMWVDTVLEYDKVLDRWSWKTPTVDLPWDTHANSQFIDYVTPTFNGVESQFVFKAECPWRVITPPGWSVLQLPLFYHFNQDFSILPGIIDTDVHSPINQQVLYHGNGKPISIKRGDPFVLYVPFKRSNRIKHKVRYQNKKDEQRFIVDTLDLKTKEIPSGTYRRKQRNRDKDLKL